MAGRRTEPGPRSTLGQGALTGAAASVGLLASRLPERPEEVAVEDGDLLVLRGTLNFYAQHVEATIADLTAAIKVLRYGRTASEPARAHLKLGQMFFVSGDWNESLRHGGVALSLSSGEHQTWVGPQAHCLLNSVLASRGQSDAAAGHLAAARQVWRKRTRSRRISRPPWPRPMARARGDSERVGSPCCPSLARATELR